MDDYKRLCSKETVHNEGDGGTNSNLIFNEIRNIYAIIEFVGNEFNEGQQLLAEGGQNDGDGDADLTAQQRKNRTVKHVFHQYQVIGIGFGLLLNFVDYLAVGL